MYVITLHSVSDRFSSFDLTLFIRNQFILVSTSTCAVMKRKWYRMTTSRADGATRSCGRLCGHGEVGSDR